MEQRHWQILITLAILIILLILTTAGGFLMLFWQNKKRDKTLAETLRRTLLQSHELERMRNSMFGKDKEKE